MLLTDIFTQAMEGMKDLFVVLTDRHFVESTTQHRGQLKSMLGFHFFNMEEVCFVCYHHHWHSVSWMQLPYVLVEEAKEFIALTVCD